MQTSAKPNTFTAKTVAKSAKVNDNFDWAASNIQGGMINGKIEASVSSNNLTVAIKTLDGSDPSASDPVQVRIGDTLRSIISALSVTKNAGTNWFRAGSGEFATFEIDYFVYLGYNATDGVVVGFSRIAHARIYSDFSVTSNDEKYAGISDISTAAASDEYEVVGRFNVTMSAGAGYTWSIPGTPVVINRPIYETRILLYEPTHGGFSVDPTPAHKYYRLKYNQLFLRYRDNGGTSNATTFTFTGPFKSLYGSWGFLVTMITDNGARQSAPGFAEIGSAATTVTLYKNSALGAWTNSGSKGCENLDAMYYI